jgi:hypothetical protein
MQLKMALVTSIAWAAQTAMHPIMILTRPMTMVLALWKVALRATRVTTIQLQRLKISHVIS